MRNVKATRKEKDCLRIFGDGNLNDNNIARLRVVFKDKEGGKGEVKCQRSLTAVCERHSTSIPLLDCCNLLVSVWSLRVDHPSTLLYARHACMADRLGGPVGWLTYIAVRTPC